VNILALADRPPDIPLVELLEKHWDAVFTLGDLTLRELRPLEHLVTPKFGVYGNHCSGTYMPELGITNLHLQVIEWQGLRLGGFQGCVRYKEDQYAPMFTQEEAAELLKDFPAVDVFLSHCPPDGINDDPDDPAHLGFIALREYVLRTKPSVLLHGHTYPKDHNLKTSLGDTQIIYVSGAGELQTS
jgi:uncharacterized protein